MKDINKKMSQFQKKYEDSELKGEGSMGKKVAKYVNELCWESYCPNFAIRCFH